MQSPATSSCGTTLTPTRYGRWEGSRRDTTAPWMTTTTKGQGSLGTHALWATSLLQPTGDSDYQMGLVKIPEAKENMPTGKHVVSNPLLSFLQEGAAQGVSRDAYLPLRAGCSRAGLLPDMTPDDREFLSVAFVLLVGTLRR